MWAYFASIPYLLFYFIAAPLIALRTLIDQARARPVMRQYDEAEATDLTLEPTHFSFRRDLGYKKVGPLERIALSDIVAGSWTEVEYLGGFAWANNFALLLEFQLRSGERVVVGTPSIHPWKTKKEVVEPLIARGLLPRSPRELSFNPSSFAVAALVFMNVLWAATMGAIWHWCR